MDEDRRIITDLLMLTDVPVFSRGADEFHKLYDTYMFDPNNVFTCFRFFNVVHGPSTSHFLYDTQLY
jgi:hypothetical protein